MAGVFLASVPANAQDQAEAPPPAASATPGCALHPSPDCRYFGVTDLGLAFGRATKEATFEGSGSGGEMNAEGGLMRRVGARNALGGTWFLKIADGDISTGPGLRYRRWLTRRQSIDLGVNLAAVSSDYKPGAVFGLLRYNPTPWVGLSVRPERIRRDTFACGLRGCGPVVEDEFRVAAGADLTGKPGAVGLVGYGAAAGVMLVLLAIAFSG